MSDLVSKICSVCNFVIIILISVVVGTLFIPQLLGYSVTPVTNQNLEPLHHPGSLLIMKPYETMDQVKIGTRVIYYDGTILDTGFTIGQEPKDHLIILKYLGSTNDQENLASLNQLYDMDSLSIPYPGYFLMKTKGGTLFLWSVVFISILLYIIPEFLNHKKKPQNQNEDDLN